MMAVAAILDFLDRLSFSYFDLAVKRNVNVGPPFLTILVDLPSLMICAKIRPKGLFGSGEEDF